MDSLLIALVLLASSTAEASKINLKFMSVIPSVPIATSVGYVGAALDEAVARAEERYGNFMNISLVKALHSGRDCTDWDANAIEYAQREYYKQLDQDESSCFVVLAIGCEPATQTLMRQHNVITFALGIAGPVKSKLPAKDSQLILLSGTVTEFATALYGLCEFRGWRSLFVLKAESSFHDLLYDPVMEKAPPGFSIEVFQINCSDSESITTALNAARLRNRIITVLGNLYCFVNVTIQANALSMLDGFVYISMQPVQMKVFGFLDLLNLSRTVSPEMLRSVIYISIARSVPGNLTGQLNEKLKNASFAKYKGVFEDGLEPVNFYTTRMGYAAIELTTSIINNSKSCAGPAIATALVDKPIDWTLGTVHVNQQGLAASLFDIFTYDEESRKMTVAGSFYSANDNLTVFRNAPILTANISDTPFCLSNDLSCLADATLSSTHIILLVVFTLIGIGLVLAVLYRMVISRNEKPWMIPGAQLEIQDDTRS